MKSSVQLTMAKVFLCLSFLWVCTGCGSMNTLFPQKPEEPQAEAAKPGAESETESAKEAEQAEFVHTVRWPGESLSLIAKWYTGSFNNWKSVAEANPRLNPDRIRIGDKIVIPQRLLKNQEPMPRDFVPTSSPKEKPTVPEKEEPKAETEAIELFGPKK